MRNKKLSWEKQKLKHNIPKLMTYSKSSSQRDIHSKKKKKAYVKNKKDFKQPNSSPKELRKEQQIEPNVSRRK